jgi:hypothetical protein
MAKYKVCGNEYDKAFELMAPVRDARSTALNVRSTRSRRFVNIAGAE